MPSYDDKMLFALFLQAVQGVSAAEPQMSPENIAQRASEIAPAAARTYEGTVEKAREQGVIVRSTL